MSAADTITVLSEDDLYRRSTQYRLWTFTPETLAALRATANAQATSAVKAAIAFQKQMVPEGKPQKLEGRKKPQC